MDVLRRINANQNQPRKSYRGHSQTYQEEGQEVQETNQEKRDLCTALKKLCRITCPGLATSGTVGNRRAQPAGQQTDSPDDGAVEMPSANIPAKAEASKPVGKNIYTKR